MPMAMGIGHMPSICHGNWSLGEKHWKHAQQIKVDFSTHHGLQATRLGLSLADDVGFEERKSVDDPLFAICQLGRTLSTLPTSRQHPKPGTDGIEPLLQLLHRQWRRN